MYRIMNKAGKSAKLSEKNFSNWPTVLLVTVQVFSYRYKEKTSSDIN